MKTVSPAEQLTDLSPSATTISLTTVRDTPAAAVEIRQPSSTYLFNLVRESLSPNSDSRIISFQSSLYSSDKYKSKICANYVSLGFWKQKDKTCGDRFATPVDVNRICATISFSELPSFNILLIKLSPYKCKNPLGSLISSTALSSSPKALTFTTLSLRSCDT